MRRGVNEISRKIGGFLTVFGLIAGLTAAPAAAHDGQPKQNLPDAGATVPFVALGSALFVIIVGTVILLAARRASRDD